jgi:N-acetylglucosamine repressor
MWDKPIFPMEKATPGGTRVHNAQLVLKTIYLNGPTSRADVSRITGLTPPTISDVVANLLADGLVEEVGYAPSSGGRRAILLRVVDESRSIIGLDLSRKDFRGAITNLRGEVKQRIDLPLDGRDGESALSLVYDLIDALIEATTSPVLGIGIGAPGLVDSSNGILQQSVNLNWRYIPLRSLLERRYDLPVYMANDCQVSALAIFTFGNHADSRLPLVVINSGWGVGAGIILDGKLLHGHPVGAGEIGHVSVKRDGRRCACGNVGCLETIASNNAIIDRVKDLVLQNPGSSLAKFIRDPFQIDLKEVIEAFDAGNEDVRSVVREAGEALGIAAANLVGTLGSCHILIGGSIGKFSHFLLDAIREEMRRCTLPSLARNTKIGIVDIDSEMVIIGATALILRHELGVL